MRTRPIPDIHVHTCSVVYLLRRLLFLGYRIASRSFDAAVPEMGATYLILALYWTHQMDSSKIARYMGLAHQSKEIISPPSPGLVASLTFVSVFLYDAKVRSVLYRERNWESWRVTVRWPD